MPARFVTLMNPSRRRRSRRARNRMGRFVRRSASPRRIRRRRSRVYANPSVRRVRRRRRIYSAPMVIRRRRVYRHSNPPAMTPARRRKISLAVRRSIRARGGSSIARRSGGRIARASSVRGGSLMSTFKSALSKPLLLKAGGAVAASIGTGYLLNRFGNSLPLSSSPYGRLLYTMGIPVVGAFLVHRKSRDLAEGMIIGGLVMSVNSLMTLFKAGGTAAAPAAVPATVASYGVSGELGFGAYPQSMRDGFALGGSNVAFPQSAW